MRQITIDFTSQLHPLCAGYIGEHNATEITVVKPTDLSGVMYSLAFMTNGEVIHSKYFSADEEIKIALWQQLTLDNDLYVQLEAFDENGDYLGKSTTAKLVLSNSVHGTDIIADADNPDVYSEIALNTWFRETLEDNVDTLDKLTTSKNGKLLFDGKLIEGVGGGSASIDVEVKADTDEEYVLEFITDAETITTPNLKGKEGKEGKQGVSGVYVGSGEMPDGYNVQIDPDGEASVIPTKTSELINDSGFITADDLPESGSGVDGFSPIVNVTEISNGHKVSVTDATGTKSFDVLNGSNGKDGKDGQDYVLTDADKTEIINAIAKKTETTTIPNFVRLEAEKVIERVLAAQGNNTFTFACITDMHYGNAGYTEGIKHACQAMKYIDERIKLDAVAVLGDYTDGYLTTTYDDAIADFKGVNSLLDGLRFTENVRQKGNHDVYPDGVPMTNRFIQAYSDNVVWGDKANGYFYKDFEEYKLRVVCVNTNENNALDSNNKPIGNISCSTAQYLWFTNALVITDKEDVSDWKILVTSHQPLDWYYTDGSYAFVKILDDYKNGRSGLAGGVTYDFTNVNSAKLIGNIHGHIHNLLVGKLNNGNVDTTDNPIDVVRVATPESCIDRANQYDGKWKQDVTYSKTKNTSQDTSFVVYCVDLDGNTITAVCYGAGYSRVIDYVNCVVIDEEVNEPILPETPEVPDEPTVNYDNLIPLSKDKDGNLYVGTNGEKGYKLNTRLNSFGEETTNGATGTNVTGLIDVTLGDKIYFKNINYKPAVNSDGNYIVLYKEDYSLEVAVKDNSFNDFAYIFKDAITDANGNLTSFVLSDASLKYKYMRVSALGLDANSVITKNQPIE